MKISMKKSQFKLMFMLLLSFVLLATLIFGITTTLQNPSDNSQDTDGWLSLNASCNPTSLSCNLTGIHSLVRPP